MLNRRSLRIKVMQNLFALEQSREANYELSLDKIRETFRVNLNAMEVQDKAVLNEQCKEALKLFEDVVANGTGSVDHEDKKVKKAVQEALKFNAEQSKKDQTFYKKNLVGEVESIYAHYIAVLSLVPAFHDVAEADKKVSHKNFVENNWVKGLCESPALRKEASRLRKDWSDKPGIVKSWFRDIIRQDNEYLSYLDKKKPTQDDQRKFVNHLFRKVILGPTLINTHFEEEVLRWAEDRDIVKGMVEKTVKSYDPEAHDKLTLHTLSVNWEDDRSFIQNLFEKGATLDQPFRKLIAANTRNWEVDRLPLTDRVILEMAIAEMILFQNIPVKVSMNEYIELAKNYSTPKSRQFINGILDVISKELKESGDLKKSGRGLMDNK